MLFKKLSTALFVIGVVLSTTIATQAANVYFVATTPGSNWSVGSNWNTGSVPSSTSPGDTVFVGSGQTSYIYPNADCTLNDARIASTFTTGHAGVGLFRVTGGSLLVTNDIRIGRLQFDWGNGNGTVYQEAGSITQNDTANIRIMALGWGKGDIGIYYLSGGTITVKGGSGFVVGLNGNGTFNLSGGTTTVSQSLWIGGSTYSYTYTGYESIYGTTADSTGVVNASGGTMTVSQNMYIGNYGAGEYNMSGGTLAVTGTVAVGNGTTGSGKFLVDGIGSTITFAGASTTFGARSTLSFKAGANGVSSIVLSNTSTGTLSINSAAQLSFDLSAMSTAANDILLVDNYGTDLISGTFATYAEGATVKTFGDGSYYTLTYAYDAATTLGTGHGVAAANDLALVAHPVPEPGTLALLAAGLFGLLAYAWRKRK
jgi:hypothetical protein